MSARDFVPPGAGLPELKQAAAGCRGCELHRDATQTVFGSGAPNAQVVLVGEQPGDQEDRHGIPFVGPAGRVLQAAVDEAGLPRERLYVTNVVKHFRFELARDGVRRIHRTPDTEHVRACIPWLAAELDRIRPELVVLLGATAAKAVFGPDFRVTRQRGALLPWPHGHEGMRTLATIHPSAVLRADDPDVARAGLVADLRTAAAALDAALD